MIAEHVYSSRFGTFIVNSESERDEVRLMSSVVRYVSKLRVFHFAIPVYILFRKISMIKPLPFGLG